MQGLSIGDGFKFGCGFILAYVVFLIGLGLLALVVTLLLGMLGLSGGMNFMPGLGRSTSMLLMSGFFV